MSAALSYSSGESATPLLGDTIGGNFDATVRVFGDREALVDRTPESGPENGPVRRWTYAELAADVDALALGLLEMGIAQGRPGRHLGAELRRVDRSSQYATAQIGAILVNINPAYRAARARVRARPVGHLDCWSRRRQLQDHRLRRDDRRGAAALPGTRDVVCSASEPGRRCSPPGRRPGPRRRAVRIELDPTTRSTSSTPRAPPASRRARRSRTTTSSTTASSSASCCGYTEARPDLHPGALLPLLRHGDGQPGRDQRTAPAWSSRRRRSTRWRRCRRSQAERCTSLYGVPTMFIAELAAAGLRRLRPVQPAHRHHGRLALPGRGDEAGHRPRCT